MTVDQLKAIEERAAEALYPTAYADRVDLIRKIPALCAALREAWAKLDELGPVDSERNMIAMENHAFAQWLRDLRDENDELHEELRDALRTVSEHEYTISCLRRDV